MTHVPEGRGRAHGAARALAAGALLAAMGLGGVGCKGLRGKDAARTEAADAGDAGGDAAAAADASPPPDDALPQTSTEELTSRARHLLEAVARDDVALATDIVFPRDGWAATRDSSDPGKDYEKRLLGPLRRAVHALSRRHADFERAQSVSLELGHSMTQQTLRKHGWAKPLWTVRDSRLTFVVDGRTRTLGIRELTAWRGAWYVTRLR